jgi:hypothetical protein
LFAIRRRLIIEADAITLPLPSIFSFHFITLMTPYRFDTPPPPR